MRKLLLKLLEKRKKVSEPSNCYRRLSELRRCTPTDAQNTKRKKRRGDMTNLPSTVVVQPSQKDTLKDRFNISNDQAYEITRERHRVRQTFGQLIVQHAYPAVKLQLPWVRWIPRVRFTIINSCPLQQYKTRLTKQESRSFHRPALQFPPNFELHFSKVRGAKRKKDRSGRKVSATGGGDPSEALRATGDISLRETGPFVLLEYSVRLIVTNVRNRVLMILMAYRKNTQLCSITSEWAPYW